MKPPAPHTSASFPEFGLFDMSSSFESHPPISGRIFKKIIKWGSKLAGNQRDPKRVKIVRRVFRTITASSQNEKFLI